MWTATPALSVNAARETRAPNTLAFDRSRGPAVSCCSTMDRAQGFDGKGASPLSVTWDCSCTGLHRGISATRVQQVTLGTNTRSVPQHRAGDT